MTQEQLAELIPLSPRQMQRLEAGEANVSLAKLIALARVLRCSMVELFASPGRQIRRKPGRPVALKPSAAANRLSPHRKN